MKAFHLSIKLWLLYRILLGLVGYSFGARMIVACLKELARNQVIWLESQEKEKDHDQSKTSSLRKSLSNMTTKQKESQIQFSREPASIIEDVILMGCTASVNSSTWLSCREVVGGRLVNCYSKNDMMIALMYRLKNVTQMLSTPVGISAVDAPGFENYDVSRFVGGHGEYCVRVREILNLVGYNQPMNV